jgi:hypothetical protein
LIWKLTSTSNGWSASSLLLEHRMEEPIEKLLFHPSETHLLIATTTTDTLCSLAQPTSDHISLTWRTRNVGVWTQHPTNPSRLILLTRSTLRIYTWASLEPLTPTGIPFHVEDQLPSDFEIRASHASWAGRILATTYSALRGRRSRIRILLWDADLLMPDTERLAPVMQETSQRVAGLVGTLGMVISMTDTLVVFLDDDGWVCSIDVGVVGGPELTAYKRHFFLPYDWLSTNDELLFACTEKGDVIFAKDDELAIIRKGLECAEVVAIGGAVES